MTVRTVLTGQKLASLAWDDTWVTVATIMVYHRQKWLSHAAKAFLKLARKHARMWQ